MGEAIGELLFRFIFEILFHFLFYWTGKIIITIATFGRYQVDALGSDMNWDAEPSHRKKLPSGKFLVSSMAAYNYGLFFWIVAMVVTVGYFVC